MLVESKFTHFIRKINYQFNSIQFMTLPCEGSQWSEARRPGACLQWPLLQVESGPVLSHCI